MARGIVRRIDELGRIVIPKEYRKTFELEENAPAGMHLDGNVVRLHVKKEKFMGFVRQLDELGRIVLPIEMRRTLGFIDRQKVDIYVDGDDICIQKVGCEWCSSTEGLIDINSHNLCRKCACSVVDKVMEG